MKSNNHNRPELLKRISKIIEVPMESGSPNSLSRKQLVKIYVLFSKKEITVDFFDLTLQDLRDMTFMSFSSYVGNPVDFSPLYPFKLHYLQQILKKLEGGSNE